MRISFNFSIFNIIKYIQILRKFLLNENKRNLKVFKIKAKGHCEIRKNFENNITIIYFLYYLRKAHTVEKKTNISLYSEIRFSYTLKVLHVKKFQNF